MTAFPFEKTKTAKELPSESGLGFGRHFSDHMFMTEYSEKAGWQNPRIAPYAPIPIDPGAAVLHYAQCIFEGLKAFRGVDGKVRVFRPDKNFDRMKASADRLCMKFIDKETFMNSLVQLVQTERRWVPSKPGTSLYLRPTLIGTEGFLGVRPSENFVYFVICSPVGSYYGDDVELVKIWVERKYSRASPGGIGAAKAGGNYAASLFAATEAKKRGYPQVLWLDGSEHRFIEEVGTMNVFFVLNGVAITPPLNGTILPGVTRDTILQLLRGRGIPVEERPIEITEIIEGAKNGKLTEAFGTGTAAGVSPVGTLGFGDEVLQINEGRIGKISTDLHKELNDIQYGRVPDKYGWLVEIPE